MSVWRRFDGGYRFAAPYDSRGSLWLFASHPFGTDEIRRIAAAAESSLHNVLLAFLSSIPSQSVDVMQRNEQFRQLYGTGMAAQEDARTIERIARLEIARGFLVDETCRRRLCHISERCKDARPVPYCIRALDDLCVGPDHLVPLVAFEYDGSRLLRNDFAFTVLSTTASPNSTYWLLGTFYEHGIDSEVAIRLDPLLFGPAQTFPRPFYFMKVYGRALHWNRIEQLRDEDHGLWLPSNLIPWVEFTDYCWVRRSPDEVHFTCEEVPKLAHVGTSASRYFHAVSQSARAESSAWMELYASIRRLNLRNAYRHTSEELAKWAAAKKCSGSMRQ